MRYLPKLHEALDWCRRAGVDMRWGNSDLPPSSWEDDAAKRHQSTESLETVRKIILHRSGFSCGNAALFRWYHRVINGWTDIGYHLVIGNGLQGDSTDGALEIGRPLSLQGAHCRGHNHDSIGICLIDNSDHFTTQAPSPIQLHALENALVFLKSKYGASLSIGGHSDYATKNCPGPAIPIVELSQRVDERLAQIRTSESEAKTLDLRNPFKNGSLAWDTPRSSLQKLQQSGINRIVYPYHWRTKPWEDLKLATEWVNEAHRLNMDVLLYTGPFGTELKGSTNEINPDWRQLKEDGQVATYDNSGYLQMFCPLSDYFREYRYPIIAEFLEATGADGVFFDIPWIVEGACACTRCRELESKPSALKTRQERAVRSGLEGAVLQLRQNFPNLWLSANAAAPEIWDATAHGATPSVLSGLFDELIVEWTPYKDSHLEKVDASIRHVRALAPAARISHAYNAEKATPYTGALETIWQHTKVGRWMVDCAP